MQVFLTHKRPSHMWQCPCHICNNIVACARMEISGCMPSCLYATPCNPLEIVTIEGNACNSLVIIILEGSVYFRSCPIMVTDCMSPCLHATPCSHHS